MIGKTSAVITEAALEKFPEFPPRDDMQNSIYLHKRTVLCTLIDHFGNPETTVVHSEVPVTTRLSPRGKFRVPDLIVAFDCNSALVDAQKGFAIDIQGKPPDFVLEVASESTGPIDDREKRDDYRDFDIPEYWRFDPSGGKYHKVALAGDILVDGEYRAVQIEWQGDERCWGYSQALRLYICWDEGWLRFYDPITEQYLTTFSEEVATRRQETTRANTEAAARREAEARAEREAVARKEAESEVQRLREELQRRSGG